MKVEKLTPEQESRLPQIRETWKNHSVSTKPADRKKAEQGALKAYKAAEMKPPSKLVWFDSPYAGCVAVALLKLAAERKENENG